MKKHQNIHACIIAMVIQFTLDALLVENLCLQLKTRGEQPALNALEGDHTVDFTEVIYHSGISDARPA